MDVLVWLLWIVLFVVWIAATIGSVWHLRARIHAPIWAVVLFVIPVVLIPFITVAVYWVVIGIIWLARRASRAAPR
jgi:hypothetical protein